MVSTTIASPSPLCQRVRSAIRAERSLGTRGDTAEEIILLHHSDCGMLTFTDDDLRAAVEKDCGIRPHFALESFADVADDVRQSMARIKANPFLLHADRVRGFVYDVTTGRLHEVS